MYIHGCLCSQVPRPGCQDCHQIIWLPVSQRWVMHSQPNTMGSENTSKMYARNRLDSDSLETVRDLALAAHSGLLPHSHLEYGYVLECGHAFVGYHLPAVPVDVCSYPVKSLLLWRPVSNPECTSTQCSRSPRMLNYDFVTCRHASRFCGRLRVAWQPTSSSWNTVRVMCPQQCTRSSGTHHD